MPRLAIPVTKPNGAVGGVVQPAVTAGSAADDHYLENDGQTILQVKNTDVVSRDITVVTSQLVQGRAVADDTQTFAAAETRILGPFDPGLYGQASDLNRVWIDIAQSTWEFRAFSSARS